MSKHTKVQPIMGEPFDVNQIDEEFAGLVQEAHDLAGTDPGPERFRRRQGSVGDSQGTPPIPRDDHEVPIANLLSIRRQTHGNFRDNARLSQALKATFRATASWDHLDDVEKESLDMIALKISRVLSGRSLERQHWEDIEGYARLALEECGA